MKNTVKKRRCCISFMYMYIHFSELKKIFKINQDLLPKQLNVTQCVFNSFEIKLKYWVKHKTKHVCFFHGVNSGSMSIQYWCIGTCKSCYHVNKCCWQLPMSSKMILLQKNNLQNLNFPSSILLHSKDCQDPGTF